MSEGFRSLKVYQRAYKASLELHRLTMTFPRFEIYELGSQMRRASKSIAMNIAEGYGKRKSAAEFKRFILMALASCDEVRVQLDYCKDLAYVTQERFSDYSSEYVEIGKMLTGLYKSQSEQ